MGKCTGLFAAMLCGAVPSLAAGVSPLGAELQVNDFTLLGPAAPRVAAGDAQFVVVWQSFGSNGDDGSNFSIQARRFGAAGDERGAQFQVNEETIFGQRYPDVALLPDEGFVVTWESPRSLGDDDSRLSVQLRRFDSSGGRLGQEFQVNTTTTDSQRSAAIAAGADGRFMVVWETIEVRDGGVTLDLEIQGRRFDTAGLPIGADFRINQSTTGSQVVPAVAATPEGGFLVAWLGAEDSGCGVDAGCIEARRFDAAGDPGPSFVVHRSTVDNPGAPAVAVAPGGGALVAWTAGFGSGNDPAGSARVEARVFDAAGGALGADFQVNTYTTGYQGRVAATALADGSFALTWLSEGSFGADDEDTSIQMRGIGSDGVLREPEVQVNRLRSAFQVDPALSASAGGGMAVVFVTSKPNSNGERRASTRGDEFTSDVRALPYRAPATIFRDGFEGGSTSEWSELGPG